MCSSADMRGIALSDNVKTVKSINVDHSECNPTEICWKTCYGRYRDSKIATKLRSTVNTGPITWEYPQKAYRRNMKNLKALTLEGIRVEAERTCRKPVVKDLGNLRFCGIGDLFENFVHFAIHVAVSGIKPWGFSKRADMLFLMAELADAYELPVGSYLRPYFLGSIDASMSLSRVADLSLATEKLNGFPALAYECLEPGWIGCLEVDSHEFRSQICVVLGYHSSHTHTILGHDIECPATAGLDVHCQECRRCIGEPVTR